MVYCRKKTGRCFMKKRRLFLAAAALSVFLVGGGKAHRGHVH